MKKASFPSVKTGVDYGFVARTFKAVASAGLVLTVLLGASGCNPAIQEELKPLNKPASASATPTPFKTQSNGVEQPEILAEPMCNGKKECRPNDLFKSVVKSAPMLEEDREKQKARHIATALTLVGPGTQNTNTARENIVAAILQADHSSHFSCFQYEMRNFVIVNEKNEKYMETAADAFDAGLPELAAFIMTYQGSNPTVTMTDYGSQKGEGFTIKGKEAREAFAEMADIQLPKAESAIESWAKAYKKSAEFGLEILNQENTTDLQSRIMNCTI